MMLAIAFAILLVNVPKVACDDNYDYVQEVLEEDTNDDFEDYGGTLDPDNSYEANILRQQQEAKDRKQEMRNREEEKLAEIERQKNEQIQREREKKFESELARMSEEKRKAARQQKKRDGAVVKKVLKAAAKGNLYGVLGLRNNIYVRIPGRAVRIVPGRYTLNLPEFRLGYATPQKIKRAYRDMAKRVHPDKSKDGRAVEAFVAVENAASILLNEKERALYDREVQSSRQAQRVLVSNYVGKGTSQTRRIFVTVFRLVRKILGPFAFPALICFVLVI